MKVLLLALLSLGAATPAIAQFGSNATLLRGQALCNPLTPTDTQTLTWSAAGNCWGPAPGGSGSGATSAGQLTDCQVVRTSATVLTACPNASPTAPVNYKVGAQITAITAPIPITLSGSPTAQIFTYFDTGALAYTVAAGTTGATCATPCAFNSLTGIPAAQVPNIPGYQWQATAGSWNAGATADLRAVYGVSGNSMAGAGQSTVCGASGCLTTIPGTSSSAATSYTLTFDGSTTSLADGSAIAWTFNSGPNTHTGSYTVPAGVNYLRYQMWAGGSGGGGGDASGDAGGGGAGGGYWTNTCAVTPGASLTITVGAGGAGGAAGLNNGTVGGSSGIQGCATVTGGAVSAVGPYGGQLSTAPSPSSSGITGLGYDGGDNSTICASGSRGWDGFWIDRGGCGAGGGGFPGGNAVLAGAGGGMGCVSTGVCTGGLGGFTGGGGNGGNGGSFTTPNVYVACTAGAAPAGGGGSGPSSSGSGASHPGCAGGAGIVYVYYTK